MAAKLHPFEQMAEDSKRDMMIFRQCRTRRRIYNKVVCIFLNAFEGTAAIENDLNDVVHHLKAQSHKWEGK